MAKEEIIREKTIIFALYRYFNEPLKGDLFEGKLSDNEKNNLISKYLFHEMDFRKDGQEYAIRHVHSNKKIIYIKFGKKERSHYYEKTEYDIEDKLKDSWPFVRVICDISAQMILVEYKSNFISFNKMATLLCEIADHGYKGSGYVLKIEPIVMEGKFWQIFAEAEKIFSLKLVLHSPNFFGASMDANEVLDKTRKIFNNTTIELQLNNEEGELKLPKDEIDKYTQYADKGGGNWVLKTQTQKRKRKYKSRESIKKIMVPIPIGATKEEIIKAVKKALDDEII
jgi:hypothetical protein